MTNTAALHPTCLWTAAAAAKATSGTTAGDWQATGISIDSRTVAKGDLFIALKGDQFDGHDFAVSALDGGAAAVMVSQDIGRHESVLTVDDTTAGLTALGIAARDRLSAPVIGVTGSVGKTGTKETLHHVLSQQGKTASSQGNLNNHYGVPLSLARLPADVDFAILEMGMNHAGELTELTELVRPHVALITAIAAAHVEFFPSVEAVAEAKAEIFQGLESGNDGSSGGGVAILPRDSDFYPLLRQRALDYGAAEVLSFGLHPDADVRLLASMMEATESTVTADIAGTTLSYAVGIPGHHWVSNSLGVLACVYALGADIDAAAKALADIAPPRGRGERRTVRLPDGPLTLIDESYNASPAAMRAAFETLMLSNPGQGGRRIAVLGDMRELGVEADALHAALAPDIQTANIDLVLCCGPHMAALHAALPQAIRGDHTPSSDDLIAAVLASLRPGDVVCVKGSLGSRMAPIVDAILRQDIAAA